MVGGGGGGSGAPVLRATETPRAARMELMKSSCFALQFDFGAYDQNIRNTVTMDTIYNFLKSRKQTGCQ